VNKSRSLVVETVQTVRLLVDKVAIDQYRHVKGSKEERTSTEGRIAILRHLAEFWKEQQKKLGHR
jgi:hypothetical protein